MQSCVSAKPLRHETRARKGRRRTKATIDEHPIYQGVVSRIGAAETPSPVLCDPGRRGWGGPSPSFSAPPPWRPPKWGQSRLGRRIAPHRRWNGDVRIEKIVLQAPVGKPGLTDPLPPLRGELNLVAHTAWARSLRPHRLHRPVVLLVAAIGDHGVPHSKENLLWGAFCMHNRFAQTLRAARSSAQHGLPVPKRSAYSSPV